MSMGFDLVEKMDGVHHIIDIFFDLMHETICLYFETSFIMVLKVEYSKNANNCIRNEILSCLNAINISALLL